MKQLNYFSESKPPETQAVSAEHAYSKMIAFESKIDAFGGISVRYDVIKLCITQPDSLWKIKVITDQQGNKRTCYHPADELAELQEELIPILKLAYYTYLEKGFGDLHTCYKKDSSIVENTKFHAHQNSCLVLDLKNAFESVSKKHIYRFLCKYSDCDLAWVLCRVFTYRGKLRQGASVSPLVFNIMMSRFDHLVAETIGAPHLLSHKHEGVVYTRYGDDICISSPENTFPEEIEGKVKQIVKDFGLNLSWKRKVGSNGIIPLPGVRVVRGIISPDIKSLRKYAVAIHNDAPPTVIRGYERFLKQFPGAGLRYARKRISSLLLELQTNSSTS